MPVTVIQETDDTAIVVNPPTTFAPVPSSVVYNFGKILTDASQVQQITAIGFTPRLILFFAGIIGAGTATNIGFAINTGPSVIQGGLDMYAQSGSVADFFQPTLAIVLRDAINPASWYQAAQVLSFDPSGFTLQWTKGGTPGAYTGDIFAICFR